MLMFLSVIVVAMAVSLIFLVMTHFMQHRIWKYVLWSFFILGMVLLIYMYNARGNFQLAMVIITALR